ncbi:GNAT family N-acetyltransferase [Holdemania massiliensis]|uniref:GNAT family N-acetyltransferase n=1 Tax=Holdemania massiliensis TaxID=1468449 RepID=UPI001F06421A|nr:GNAT family N-acetyltransferase [Holdemania massiliensis]MCH1941700.1 GNAT family N-acetyltransferase [Holdemania massiliensis]
MITFQSAQEDEIELIYQLYRRCANTSRGSWDDEYPTLEFVKQDYAQQGLMTLKNERNEIIAAGAITSAEELKDLPRSTELHQPLELSRLGVDPKYQRQGYGRLLLHNLIEEVRRRHADGIQLLAASANIPALSLYRHTGFEEKGSFLMYGIDFILLEKRF